MVEAIEPTTYEDELRMTKVLEKPIDEVCQEPPVTPACEGLSFHLHG